MTANLSESGQPSVPSSLQGGGFESGTPNTEWNECSLNFVTPICDVVSCSVNDQRSGSWWAWFGGASPNFPEYGSVHQYMTIPGRSCATLSFYLEMPPPTPLRTGYINAVTDGNTVFTATHSDYATYPSYTQVSQDISAYADGGIHNVRFDAFHDGGPTGFLNFYVDDVNVTTTSKTFDDVSLGHWAENFIAAIGCNNITTGCSGNNYCPNNKVSRAEMAAFIIRAIYGETFSYSSTPYFTDVPGAPTPHWAFKYIQKMRDENITTGCAGSNYCPNNRVSRAEMAAFIIRSIYGETFSYGSTPYFSDVASGFWAFKYIQKMLEDGVTTGCSAGTYCPTNKVSRAEMAAFLTRAYLK